MSSYTQVSNYTYAIGRSQYTSHELKTGDRHDEHRNHWRRKCR
jgi:hypothetical protein